MVTVVGWLESPRYYHTVLSCNPELNITNRPLGHVGRANNALLITGILLDPIEFLVMLRTRVYTSSIIRQRYIAD